MGHHRVFTWGELTIEPRSGSTLWLELAARHPLRFQRALVCSNDSAFRLRVSLPLKALGASNE